MASTQEELLKQLTALLEKKKISYMITGAYAVVYYGRMRASHDLDFVVELTEADVPRLLDVFRAISPFDFVIDERGIKEDVMKKQFFNVLYLPMATKIDFWPVKDNEFDRLKFSRRRKVMMLGQAMTVTSAEDTILQKLRWYGQGKIEKHLVDAAFIWQLQKRLDKDYIDKWAKKLGVENYLEELGKIDLEDHY